MPLGQLFAYTLPLLVAVGWVVLLVCKRRSNGRLELALGVFLLAAWLGMYPRFDVYHMVATLPVFLWGLVLLAHAAQEHGIGVPLGGRGGAFLVPGLALLLFFVSFSQSFLRFSRGELVLTLRPHFRGALLPVPWEERVRLHGHLLRAQAAKAPGFLVSPFAGFWYLVAAMKNPTPFDYPMSTAFGRKGEEQVIRALEAGAIPWVCWERGAWPLRPQRLEAYLVNAWRPGEDLGVCQVYERPLAPP